MIIYVLSIIAISILFIPVSFASTENIEFSKASDGTSVYLFVQIIHRDSDGNLLGFIQSDRMTYLDPDLLNWYVDQKGRARTVMGPDPNGPHFEIFGEKFEPIFSDPLKGDVKKSQAYTESTPFYSRIASCSG